MPLSNPRASLPAHGAQAAKQAAKPVTLSNLRAAVPRAGDGAPLKGSATSAPGGGLGPGGPRGPPPTALRLAQRPAPETRGGVVYERDGFEIFYGLAGASEEAEVGGPRVVLGDGAERPVRPKLDGYEKFYGIRSRDKLSAGARVSASAAAAGDGHAATGPTAQDRLLASAHPALAPPPVQAPTSRDFGGAGGGAGSCPAARSVPRIAAPSGGAADTEAPSHGVPTFAMATPAPPMEPAMPSGVDIFSVATPRVPPQHRRKTA